MGRVMVAGCGCDHCKRIRKSTAREVVEEFLEENPEEIKEFSVMGVWFREVNVDRLIERIRELKNIPTMNY